MAAPASADAAAAAALSREVALLQNSLRVAVIGNVDSGKSSLTATLTRGILDDGRGSARAQVFRHKHEKETGRSSSVASEIMGFDGERPLYVDAKASRQRAWQACHERASRTVTFVDLCGHAAYLKSTLFGLSSTAPDYSLVVVGLNMGLSQMTKEHLGISIAMGIPLIVVATKVDLAPPDVAKHTLDVVSKTLKQARKLPFAVRTPAQAATAARAILTERVTPVFTVSNVTGEGLDLLRQLLRELPPRVSPLAARGLAFAAHGEVGGGIMAAAPAAAAPPADGSGGGASTTPAKTPPPTPAGASAATGAPLPPPPPPMELAVSPGEAVIDSTFNVTGVGLVVAGTVTRGVIRVGSTMLLGPDRLGEFTPVTVRSIHVQYTPVEAAFPGGSAAFAIRPKGGRGGGGGGVGPLASDRKKHKSWARKGMRLVDPALHPASAWEFTAEVLVLHHQTTLSVGYSPVVHAGAVVQAAKVTAIASAADGSPLDAIRTGDRAVITARWCYRPEYVHPGEQLLFREGRSKGVGRVTAVARPNGSGGGGGGGGGMVVE